MSGPYLDPWYERLAEAYKATMADLGVSSALSPAAFLDAMAGHKTGDPGMTAVLSAIKSTVKGGIGKLRERPQGAKYRPGERWPALECATWRPDIRATVIAATRVNLHRKMLKTALATQGRPVPAGSLVFDQDALLPIALLSDCVVCPVRRSFPVGRRAVRRGGMPVSGVFRRGVSPGMVEHGGIRELFWAVRVAGPAAQSVPAYQGRRCRRRRGVGREWCGSRARPPAGLAVGEGAVPGSHGSADRGLPAGGAYRSGLAAPGVLAGRRAAVPRGLAWNP